ncbi:MAG: hypothetical protein K9M97_06990, partial [Akkermansiaceae bacterium]|nr:hypothetical protein [Akkermansiaceae bacterium]
MKIIFSALSILAFALPARAEPNVPGIPSPPWTKPEKVTENFSPIRAGLVRAIMAHKGYAADARHWAGAVSKDYRMILLAEGI